MESNKWESLSVGTVPNLDSPIAPCGLQCPIWKDESHNMKSNSEVVQLISDANNLLYGVWISTNNVLAKGYVDDLVRANEKLLQALRKLKEVEQSNDHVSTPATTSPSIGGCLSGSAQ